MKPAILVTGGAGYIGAHMCKTLARNGYLPVTLDNLSLGHRTFVRWGPLVEADIADEETMSRVCQNYKIAAAMHFAAFALVEESVREPALYYKNNVGGTISLLKGLQNAGVDKIVFSSSCAIYGQPQIQPIDEGTAPSPINSYGRSKLMIEQILNDYGKAYNLRWLALRYFNACGADLDTEIGELRTRETHLVPRAMMWLQGHLADFQVFGDDYPTPDGTAVRDYIHVVDLADAHLRALRHLLSVDCSMALNVGTGRGYSVKEVLVKIAQVTGKRIPMAAAGRRAGDPPILTAGTTAIRSELGFTPSHSDLDTIIQTAWAWHQKAHPYQESPTS